jgi:hypothetical protein
VVKGLAVIGGVEGEPVAQAAADLGDRVAERAGRVSARVVRAFSSRVSANIGGL